MIDVIDLCETLVSLKPNKVLVNVLSDLKTQQFIIDLNTEEQLLKGIDSTGQKLSDIGGDYSVTTQLIKGVTDPSKVTLYDTGDYYASYDIKVLRNGDFEILSDPIKDGKSLEARWGDNLEGLTEENLKKVYDLLGQEIIKYIQSLL